MFRFTLLLGVALSLSAAAEARPYLFDFGTADSPVRPGFTAVTAKSLYAPGTGFGWQSTKALKTHYQAYSREWKMNEGRGRTEPPPIYANELTCDSLFGDQPATFLVDVPAGQYCVWVLAGRSAGSNRDYHWFEVRAGGASAEIKIPGPYRFERRELTAQVAKGPLAIEFVPKSDFVVAGLAVVPVAEMAAFRQSTLDALEKEIDFLPPDVAEKWQETKHVDRRPPPAFSPADQRRGYALFRRPWCEPIYPNTVPRTEELDPQLKAFATLGEYEPVTLAVCPLRDLGDARLVAGDLRMGDAVIPAARLEVRSVRYMLVRPNYSLFNSYHVAPDVLEKRDVAPMRQGVNQRFWITIHVPDDAQPGVYTGKLVFQPSGGEAAEVPLTLRVLGLRLRTNPEHIYGNYYHDPLHQFDAKNTPVANAYFQHKAEVERRDMVEHGMNTHTSDVSGVTRDKDGNWTCDGEETDRRIALDRKYGLAQKPLVAAIPVGYWYGRLVDPKGLGSHMRLVRDDVPQSFYDEVTRMTAAVEQERKRRGWPELLYYPIDEPSTSAASVKFMVNVLRAIKQVPGVRTYVTADPSEDGFEPLWPHVDVWCCQPFVFGYDKIQRLSREKKIEFWCYPNHISGENDHTPVSGARMTWGYGFWKSGFRALIPWIYQASGGDPWNYLDSSSSDFFNRSTPEGEPIPVTLWEAYREGIDDGRYIYTLEQLVAEGRRRGGAAAQAAVAGEAALRRLWDDIAVQEKYKFDDLWHGDDFDARRWVLATHILALEAALK